MELMLSAICPEPSGDSHEACRESSTVLMTRRRLDIPDPTCLRASRMKRRTLFIAIHCLVFSAAAARSAEPDPSKPTELKVLDRLVGKWDSESVSRVAEWTPKEVRATGVLTREWVLEGRYVQETNQQTDADAMVMFTYDTSKRAHRSWLFNSQGINIETSGQWDEKTQTLTSTSELANGLSNTATIQFLDADTHKWTAIVKDGQGKVFFDAGGTCTRRK